MKKIFSGTVVMAVIAGMVFAYVPFLAPQTSADISSWQKGASIYPNSSTDFASPQLKQSLTNLKATGANYVTFIIPYYQSGFSTTDIQPGYNTPTDQALIAGIDTAHSLGLKVMLKVHDDVFNSTGWRANINPSDRTTWFTNYGNVLNHLADISKAHNVEEICLGTEMVDMSTYRINPSNTQNWIKMIQSVRSRYSGLLTYDANWGDGDAYNETKFIGFWPNLDYIGISGYYDLTGDSQASVASLLKSWANYDTTLIQPLYNQFHKPILFSEVGYRSVTGASGQPWNYYLSGAENETEQANAYTALFQYWNGKSYFAGVQLWKWELDPNAGGPHDTNYTPQNKLAEGVMKQWFGGAVVPPSNPPTIGTTTGTTTKPIATSTPAATWTVQASGSVGNAGQSTNLSVSLIPSSETSNLIIDTEIFDGTGHQIYQQFFQNQNPSPQQPGRYTISWTPQLAGKYTLEVGVFNNDWSKNYYWNNSLMEFVIQQASSTPIVPPVSTSTPPTSTSTPPISTSTPPTTFDTNIWWPTDGTTISGVQPFKAMVINKSVSDYTMFWQVDGGQLNQMDDNSTDYPHKEAAVDVSGWHWQASGNYSLNFLSKDQSGKIISQKGITIKVQN